MRLATTVFVVALVALTFGGCGNQESSAPTAEAPPEPPSVSLHEAAIMGNVDAIRQHAAAGTNLDEKDAYGSTPLVITATFGVTDAAKALIDEGADWSLTNDEGSTPLHIAAFLCHTEIVEALLAGGADTDALNTAGRTPLQSVDGPFEDSKPIYDGLAAALAPLGLVLDYDHIQETRPVIADMLR